MSNNVRNKVSDAINQFYVENILENVVILGLVGIMFSAVKTLA